MGFEYPYEGKILFYNINKEYKWSEVIMDQIKKFIPSNIFDLSLSTFFYTKVERIAKQLFDSEINKKFYYDKRIISDSDLYYNNYNNYDFDDNIIYKDYPKK